MFTLNMMHVWLPAAPGPLPVAMSSALPGSDWHCADFRLKKGAIQSNTEKSVKKVTRKRKGINAHPANSHQAGTMIKVRPWSTVTDMVCSQRRSRDRLRLRFHARLAGATLLSHVRAAHVASRLFRLPRAISGAQCGFSAPAWLQTLAPRCCAFPHLAPHLS